MSENLIVAIDGPAGSGKSTSAKMVARKLGYLYIDTGAMYRAVTFASMRSGIMKDTDAIAELAEKAEIKLSFENGDTRVFLNNEELTDDIRSFEVNTNVSFVSAIERVRKSLVQKQREMGNTGCGVVMEGRDIATVVFPNADVKIFLTATIDQRTERRLKEYEGKGKNVSFDEIKKNLLYRDDLDSNRGVNPLIKAPDSIEVDTSTVSIDDQVALILNEVKKAGIKKGFQIKLQ